MNNIIIQTSFLLGQKSMLFLTCTWKLYIAFKASKSTKCGSALKNKPFYMCSVFVFLELRLAFSLMVGLR